MVAAAVSVLGLALSVPASAVSHPSVAVGGTSSLDAIACPTSVKCVAVGSDVDGNAKTAVVEVGSGAATAWSGKVPPSPFDSIACAVPTVCVAFSLNQSARVSTASGAASIVSTVHAPSGSITALDRAACPSASECFAVGFIGTEAHSKALVARFSATGTLLGTVEESGKSGVGAIACPTSTTCLLAVANLKNPEVIQTFTNGHYGGVHSLPANTYVQQMACYKAVVCYALGGKSTGNVGRTNLLIELNPATGAVSATHSIGGGFDGTGIACGNASQCIVSGIASGKAMIDIATKGIPAAPRKVAGSSLSGIACTDTDVCFVVGQNTTSGIVEKV